MATTSATSLRRVKSADLRSRASSRAKRNEIIKAIALSPYSRTRGFLSWAYRRPAGEQNAAKALGKRFVRGTILTAGMLLALQSPLTLSHASRSAIASKVVSLKVPPAVVRAQALNELETGTAANVSRTGRFIVVVSKGTAQGARVVYSGAQSGFNYLNSLKAEKVRATSPLPAKEPRAPTAPAVQKEKARAVVAKPAGPLEFSDAEMQKIRRFVTREKEGNKANPAHLKLLESEAATRSVPPALSFAVVDHESDFRADNFHVNTPGYSKVIVGGKFLANAPNGKLLSLPELLKVKGISVDFGLGQVNNEWARRFPDLDLLSTWGNAKAHARILKDATFATVNGRRANILELEGVSLKAKLTMIGARYNGGNVSFSVPAGKNIQAEQIQFLGKKAGLRDHFLRYGNNLHANWLAYKKTAERK